MPKVRLLDCTLRDGGYLVNKNFKENTVHNIVQGLTQAGVDFVEIGFLQDEISSKENVTFFNSVDARKFIPKSRGNTLYTAFADLSRYSVDNLDDHDGQSFDCVRACFFKEERKDAPEFCQKIQQKGYKVFVQPVGILRYSLSELIDLIADFNEISPYVFGVVDTFGSMLLEDLQLKIAVIHSELSPEIALGFHSHNNMELSNALSQQFLRLMKGERDICVDTTLNGIGRGAGNARTELMVDYMNKRFDKQYDLDIILDLIDNCIQNLTEEVAWGYDIQMYLAGIYSCHINNVKYLYEKASIRSKDICYILGNLNDKERARYDYARLDELYLEFLYHNKRGSDNTEMLRNIVHGKEILVIVPGNTINTHKDQIAEYIRKKQPIVISLNFTPEGLDTDFAYFNNPRRYDFMYNSGALVDKKVILTTNVTTDDSTAIIIPIEKVARENTDNSTVVLLYLLDTLGVKQITLAGFDGFSDKGDNYVSNEFNKSYIADSEKNVFIQKAFDAFLETKKTSDIRFITPSMFDGTSR